MPKILFYENYETSPFLHTTQGLGDLPSHRSKLISYDTDTGLSKLLVETAPLEAPGHDLITGVTTAGGQIYFAENLSFYESLPTTSTLWGSDGTAVFTVPIKAFPPDDILVAGPGYTASVHGDLLFWNYDLAHGYEPWVTDGTPQGTYRLLDINPGPDGSLMQSILTYKGDAYFSAADASGANIWRSDGTTGGTEAVTHFTDSNPLSMTMGVIGVSNGLVYFERNGELWRTNGTEEGTIPIPGAGQFGFDDHSFTNGPNSKAVDVDGKLVLIGNDFNDGGLWVTSGSTMSELVAGPITSIVKVGNRAFFSELNSSSNRAELWETNGTVGGTLFVDSLPSFGSSFVPVAAGSTLYFVLPTSESQDPQTLVYSYTMGLFKSDGTPGGITLVRDFGNTAISQLYAADGKVYFDVVDGGTVSKPTASLWSSDGTPGGTVEVLHSDGSLTTFELTVLNDAVLFTRFDDSVDFNALTVQQQTQIDENADIYDALSGNDTVVLPDTAHFALTATADWDDTETFNAGAGNDTFDFQTHGLAGYAAGSVIFIDGSTNESNGRDIIKLPGRANDYTINVDFSGASPGEETTTIVGPNNVTFKLNHVEAAAFAQPINNTVNLTASHGSIALEMLQLADDVYGHYGQPDIHSGNFAVYADDPLASDVAKHPTLSKEIADRVESRGWHPLSAIELGIPPADLDPPEVNDRYSFDNGLFQTSIGGGLGNASAEVVTGIVDGKVTLAVTFSGIDQIGDLVEWSLDTTYLEFGRLVDALNAYLADTSHGIQQLLVSGHNTGGGAVQNFLNDLPSSTPYTVQAYTDGAVAASAHPQNPNITNFIHTDDPFSGLITAGSATAAAVKGTKEVGEALLLPFLAVGVGTVEIANAAKTLLGGFATGFPNILHPIDQDGGKVFIDSDVASSFGNPAEISSELYMQDLTKILQFANDPSSVAFYNSELAQHLRANTVFLGELQIALGADGQASMSMHAGDDYVLGDPDKQNIIYWLSLQQTAQTEKVHIVDGGGGIGPGDILVLPGTSGNYDWHTTTVNGALTTTLTFAGSNVPIAQLDRVDCLIFALTNQAVRLDHESSSGFAPAAPPISQFVVNIDGSAVSVQNAAPGASALTVDHNFQYTDAGDGNLTVTGTDLGDIIAIGSGTDTINDGGGDDIIFVKDALVAGNLTIHSGAGSDLIVTGAGSDVLDGGAGADTMSGGGGDDTYWVDNGGDLIKENTGDGVDLVFDSAAQYVLPDNVENVIITSSSGVTLTGNDSDNVINGGIGADSLNGGDGNDTIFAGAGSDVVSGGAGNDTLVANTVENLFAQEHDTLSGGDGSDTLYGEAADTLDGGAGFDVLQVINAYDMHLDLQATSIEYVVSDFGSDTYTAAGSTTAVEVYGSGGNDTITGGSADDRLWGGVGNDTLVGNEGNDVLVGDLGADSLSGGAGNDRLYVDPDDTLIDGGDGFDAAYITTGSGINLNMANTHLEWAADFAGGNDTIDASGVSVHVEMYAAGGNDTLTGGSADDLIFAGTGNDTIVGGGGNDALVGEAGSDRLTGGLGNDRLYGTNGAGGDGAVDTFVFTNNWGSDTVFDFEHGVDKLDMTGVTGVHGMADLTITSNAGNAYIAFGGDLISISGMAGQITQNDLLFA